MENSLQNISHIYVFLKLSYCIIYYTCLMKYGQYLEYYYKRLRGDKNIFLEALSQTNKKYCLSVRYINIYVVYTLTKVKIWKLKVSICILILQIYLISVTVKNKCVQIDGTLPIFCTQITNKFPHKNRSAHIDYKNQSRLQDNFISSLSKIQRKFPMGLGISRKIYCGFCRSMGP